MIKSLNERLVFGAFVLLFCLCSAINCAAQKTIAGHWEGVLILQEGSLRKELQIAVDFVKKADGCTGVFYSEASRRASGNPLAAVEYAPPEIRFALADESLQFDGILAGDTIKGTVKNHDDDKKATFTLTRTKVSKRKH